VSGKSTAILWEVIRETQKEGKEAINTGPEISRYSHFYVKKIVIYSPLNIPLF